MSVKKTISSLIVIILTFSVLQFSLQPIQAVNLKETPTLSSVLDQFNRSPGYFTENKGQWDPSILFIGETSFGKVAFSKEAIYYQLSVTTNTNKQYNSAAFRPDQAEMSYKVQIIKLSFVNSQNAMVHAESLLPHYNNYFIGNDSSRWASYCRNFAKVRYEDIWEGIDLAYFFTDEGMKYEYYVSPEADIQDLQIKVEGADLSNHNDSLVFKTTLGNIQDADLKVFDTANSEINASFLLNNNTISFQGIPEKRNHTVIIDPLVYSTYLGGSDTDYLVAIAVDSLGNAYVTGYTLSNDFPITPGSFNTAFLGVSDVVISKLNPDGNALIYSTYIGGAFADYSDDIKLDSQNNISIIGTTYSTDWPVTPGAFDTSMNSQLDAFVVKVNSSGTSLLFSTYLGGNDSDSPDSLEVDSLGYHYIVGSTFSTDFPVTPMALQPVSGGFADIFVTKISPAGSILYYSTYIGGSAFDYPNDSTLYNDRNILFAGNTSSSDFPTTLGSYQPTSPLGENAIVCKVDSYGTTLLYSTFLGGSQSDFGTAIISDASGNAYVTGYTYSPDFPLTPGAYQTVLNADGMDGFVTKLNHDGNALFYSTLIGGTNTEKFYDIAIDMDGNAYITGDTRSADFPVTTDALQPIKNDSWDCLFTQLDAVGSTLLYSTFMGGDGDDDEARSIVLDQNGDVYITGSTEGEEFPITPGAFKTTKNYQHMEGFVCKFHMTKLTIDLTGSLYFNQVSLQWLVNNPSQYPVFGYRVYRDSQDEPPILLSFIPGDNIRSYQDLTGEIGSTYMYFIEAVNANQELLATSNFIYLGPIQALPDPELDLSVELNKHEFCYGDDVLYKVTIHNMSPGPANEIKLLVTFPDQIKYNSAGSFRGQVQAGGNVLFEIGSIPGNASLTFQINALIAQRASVKNSVVTVFYVNCSAEDVFAETVVYTTLKSCDGGNPVPYIKAVLLNTQFDPETGERYIEQNKELLMDVTIDGFTPPYGIEIVWGDGERDVLSQQTEKTFHLKHKFTSKGVMEIRIHVTDTAGKSKEVSLRIRVK